MQGEVLLAIARDDAPDVVALVAIVPQQLDLRRRALDAAHDALDSFGTVFVEAFVHAPVTDLGSGE